MKDPKSTVNQHIQVGSLSPVVDCGRYPVKRIVGESCVVEADIFRYGHEILRAVIKWRRKHERKFAEVPMVLVNWGLDHWSGQFPLKENGRYVFTVEAWTDRFASWVADLKKRVEAGQENVASEVSEGLRLVRDVQRRAKGRDRKTLDGFITKMSESVSHSPAVLELALRDELSEIMTRLQKREDSTLHMPFLEVDADRPKARFGAWYEIFVRSQGKTPGKGATFRDAEWRFPDIHDMGFDVLYLAPIHPIGTTNRKGRNNTIRAGKLDPGSPWAIGSKHGGFTEVEPSLGTLSDFDHFVKAAKRHGLEVALDFALQCSPDHPWVREHPEWFYHRPDGTIKYAENPPKKYEDIYPVNFHTENWKLLWNEIRKILLFWIGHGVKIFRVDNPHTKPTAFWQWLIEEIHAKHPDVIFLSEAFTRPRVMHALAKAGFTQSYTYFTWRNTKSELTEYLTELTQSGVEQYLRPNFFVNTPDILQEFLQKGGPPAFRT
ncbi:MAG TPA: maltotransferase domain-containing protein, partial [Bacteroidota bacterium]